MLIWQICWVKWQQLLTTKNNNKSTRQILPACSCHFVCATSQVQQNVTLWSRIKRLLLCYNDRWKKLLILDSTLCHACSDENTEWKVNFKVRWNNRFNSIFQSKRTRKKQKKWARSTTKGVGTRAGETSVRTISLPPPPHSLSSTYSRLSFRPDVQISREFFSRVQWSKKNTRKCRAVNNL